jgi:hypothetical protein
MKKLFLVLLIVVLAAFLLVGCLPVTPGEGEGEGESEVTVVIDGAVVIDGKTYVSAGPHDITITFPSPVACWVDAWLSSCTGDYSKSKPDGGGGVVLFPDADKKVWTGSATFTGGDSHCCATYIEIAAGECTEEACVWFPVIVDSELPYATIEICIDECTCAGCELTFTSTFTSGTCSPDELNCGDDCSGLASWSILLYEDYPFDDCCEIPCTEPLATYSGTGCPIEVTTDCLGDSPLDTLYVVAYLVDKVGNEAQMGTYVRFNPDDCDSMEIFYKDPAECLDNPYESTIQFVTCCDALPVKELLNGNFETGEFSDWIVTVGGIFPQVQSTETYSGNYAAYMSDGNGGLGGGNIASIEQTINITADLVNPLLKINYRVIGTDYDGEGYDWMKFYINDTEIFYVWSDTSDWQEFQYDLSAYTCTSINLKISAWTSDALYTADYFVDNISITSN